MKNILLASFVYFCATIVALEASARGKMQIIDGKTVVHFTEVAKAEVFPDRIIARLEFQEKGKNVVEVQAALNKNMEAAVKKAKKLEGVKVSTSSYRVNETYNHNKRANDGWQASQTLKIKGSNVAKILELVGELQGKGMVGHGFTYFISTDLLEKTKRELTEDVMMRLGNKVKQLSAQLQMTKTHIAELKLDKGSDQPILRPQLGVMKSMAMAEMSAPPVSEAEEQTVNIMLDAVVVFEK